MESWPQNPEFKNDPENFHPCRCILFCLNKTDSKPIVILEIQPKLFPGVDYFDRCS